MAAPQATDHFQNSIDSENVPGVSRAVPDRAETRRHGADL